MGDHKEDRVLDRVQFHRLRELIRGLEGVLLSFHSAYNCDSAVREGTQRCIECIENGLGQLLRCVDSKQRYQIAEVFLKIQSSTIRGLEGQLGRIRDHFSSLTGRWCADQERDGMGTAGASPLAGNGSSVANGVAADLNGPRAEARRVRVLARYDETVKEFMEYVEAFEAGRHVRGGNGDGGIIAPAVHRQHIQLTPSRKSGHMTPEPAKVLARLRIDAEVAGRLRPAISGAALPGLHGAEAR